MNAKARKAISECFYDAQDAQTAWQLGDITNEELAARLNAAEETVRQLLRDEALNPQVNL